MNLLLTSDQDMRLTTYGAISTELALLSDKHLSQLLRTAMPIGTSIGGATALLKINGANIFVKKIRLTDIERQPENILSTANVFDLPLYYQYGIGSSGFGVWRELTSHIMSTNWVLTGECLNFPLMYHWRMMPRSMLDVPTIEELKKLERDVEHWDGSLAIRARLLANLKASADIILFLEYIPENLHTWLRKQITEDSTARSAFAMVESNLKAIISFINSRSLLHFDAHFENVLTDGYRLYFADFGLAICARFELSEIESDFFKKHYNYDRYYTMAHLVKWILIELFGIENYDTLLHEYALGKGRKALAPSIAAIITRYAPIAVVMNEFYRKLRYLKQRYTRQVSLSMFAHTTKFFET